MAEIRQIQVDGVNYDLVVSEDEVSATAAAQSAAQALAYKNQAQTSAAQAQTQATNASNQADRAEDAASRAEQIVGGEFLSYGGDQGLDETQKEQARKNAVVGKSNYNLLDNPFFTAGNVVNQRGFSSSSTEGYTVDRWKLLRSNIITATLGNDGMTISKSVTGYAFFEQIIGTSIDLEATYTLSVMTSDGQVYSATRKFVNGTSSETYVSIGGMNVGFGLYGKDTTPHAALYFGTSQTGSLTIKAIKLELGTYSTLANDTKPDYATELARCIYSRADSTDFYANNGFGRSNRNLLDNGWFTVNQRGYTNASTGDSYIADRWKIVSTTQTVTNSNSVISFSGGSYTDLRQMGTDELFRKSLGKTFTVSFNANGTVYSGVFTLPTTVPSSQVDVCNLYPMGSTGNYVRINFYWNPSSGIVGYRLVVYGSVTLYSVKLELGSVSTLANDAPPDYAEELLKCLRYFQRIKASQTYCPIGTGLGASSSTCYVFVPLPVPLRAYPTILAVNTVAQFHIYGENADKAISAMSVRGISSNGVTLSVTATGVTTYGTYMLVTTDSNAYFDLSAEP